MIASAASVQVSADFTRAAKAGELAKIRAECDNYYRGATGKGVLDPTVQTQIVNVLTAAVLLAAKSHPDALLNGVDELLFPPNQFRLDVLAALIGANDHFVKKTGHAIASLSSRTQDAIFLALDQLLTPTRLTG